LDASQRGEIVLMVLRKEEPLATLARRYDVSETTLHRWRDEFLAGARAADASARCNFVGGPRVDGPLRHLAEGHRVQLRDQAERALAAFAECLADAENRRAPTVLQLDRARAWLTWYRRLLYSPLSGSGELRATRVEKPDDADPNLKFLRQEVQKAGRVKTLRNYRDETYQYLQRAEETLK
jgi:transposase-like protein